MNIQLLRKKDFPKVQQMAKLIWEKSYPHIYSPKRINYYVTTYYSDKELEKDFTALKKGKKIFLCAWEKDTLLGYSSVALKKTPELMRMYVRPGKQRKGVGQKLLSRIETKLLRKSYTTLELFTHKKLTRAHKFYEKQGYVRVTKKDDGSSICYKKKLS